MRLNWRLLLMKNNKLQLKIGDRVIFLRDHWMGGFTQSIERISARITKIKGERLYDLARERDGTPIYNVSEDEIEEVTDDQDYVRRG